MKSVLLFAGLMTAFSIAPLKAQSLDYPTKPITMVVPFSAGGPSDVLARTYAEGLTKKFGQTVVVENKPGAGGNIGTNQVARSDPAGYSLVLGMVGTHAINQSLYKKIPHNVVDDFAPIALVGSAPIVLVASRDSGLRSIGELLKKAKDQPGSISYASPGAGTPQHLAAELLQREAGIQLGHIPYKGGAPALNDVLGNHVELGFVSLPAALPHIRSGKVYALGLASAERSGIAPDITTIAEEGVPGYAVENWYALFGPAAMPADRVQALNSALLEIVNQPETKERLAGAGFNALHSKASELKDYQRKEVARWQEIIRDAGISVE